MQALGIHSFNKATELSIPTTANGRTWVIFFIWFMVFIELVEPFDMPYAFIPYELISGHPIVKSLLLAAI